MNSDDFPAFDFSGFSEADIREEVIAPILRRLGYRSGTENTILREREIRLRYPHMFLGRKRPGKDPELIGRPDYICDARNITRWAIEAKSPVNGIGRDDIEQAHSYAVHAELMAPLFVLTNGKDWLVYESNRGPAAAPILKLTYDQVRSDFHLLYNLLSPAGLNRRYPVLPIDYGLPLTDGVGSKAKILGDFTRYDEIEIVVDGLPPGITLPDIENAQRLVGYTAAITGDRCYRDDERGIVADLRLHHPYASMAGLVEALGLSTNRYATRAPTVSRDPNHPTIFEFVHGCMIPANTRVFNFANHAEVTTPFPLRMVFYAEAIGYLDVTTFKGTYSARLLSEPQRIPIQQWAFMRGSFEVQLQPE